MSYVDSLIEVYGREVARADRWNPSLARLERIWIAVYPPAQERQVRARIEGFCLATQQAHHSWEALDLGYTFAQWLGSQEYREAYFEDPDSLDLALDDFMDTLAAQVNTALRANPRGMVALYSLPSLFGLLRVSALLDRLEPEPEGRVLALMPGDYENGNLRFLNARDGWNYLSVVLRVDY